MDTREAQGLPAGEPRGLTEVERVEAWRLHVLLDAGYPVQLAEQLASSSTVDLHQAVELLDSGCTAETAARILL